MCAGTWPCPGNPGGDGGRTCKPKTVQVPAIPEKPSSLKPPHPAPPPFYAPRGARPHRCGRPTAACRRSHCALSPGVGQWDGSLATDQVLHKPEICKIGSAGVGNHDMHRKRADGATTKSPGWNTDHQPTSTHRPPAHRPKQHTAPKTHLQTYQPNYAHATKESGKKLRDQARAPQEPSQAPPVTPRQTQHGRPLGA